MADLSVLVVEDNLLASAALLRLMKNHDDIGQVVEVRSLAEARKIVTAMAFDVVFLDVCLPDGTGDLRLTVTNTGAHEGAAVVQLYVSPPETPVDRPDAELKSFAKLTLAPGDSGIATLALEPRDFAWFDVDRRCWTVTAGDYVLRLGTSAADIFTTATVQIQGQDLPLRG